MSLETKTDKIISSCMGTMLRVIYLEDQYIEEMFEHITHPKEVKDKAFEELKKLELIEVFCFGKAVDLTDKGRKLIRDSIDETLERQINRDVKQ